MPAHLPLWRYPNILQDHGISVRASDQMICLTPVKHQFLFPQCCLAYFGAWPQTLGLNRFWGPVQKESKQPRGKIIGWVCHHTMWCLISPMLLLLHREMGKVEGYPQPNEDITSSPTSSLSWKFVEDLEFSPKQQRCRIFTAFLTRGNLVKMPPLREISDLHKMWHR